MLPVFQDCISRMRITRKTFMDRQRGVNVKPTVRKILQTGICVFLFFEAHAQSPFHAIDDSLISRGIDQVFSMEFDSALSSFRQVMGRHPEHTVGYFYMASTYQSMMMDQETDRWETVFFDLIEKAISIGENAAGKPVDDP